jgi:hypothetical protein
MPFDPHAPTCTRTGKVCFPTRRLANQAIADIRAMERGKVRARRLSTVDARSMNAYPCVWCSHWHIGHAQTPKHRRSRRRFLHDED